MTPAEADWVAERVITRWALSGHKLPDLRVCPCQWGPSGHCDKGGNHAKCVHHGRLEGWPRRHSETRVIGRDGSALVDVWRVGTPCMWRCPCPVCAAAPTLPGLETAFHRHKAGAEVPGRRPTPLDEQLSLFDLAGAA